MRRLAPGLVGLLALLGALPAGAATAGVTIADNSFQPQQITITAGDTVTWHDTGSNPHSVTSDDGVFDSSPSCSLYGGGCLSKGQTFSFTFTQPGTYAY